MADENRNSVSPEITEEDPSASTNEALQLSTINESRGDIISSNSSNFTNESSEISEQEQQIIGNMEEMSFSSPQVDLALHNFKREGCLHIREEAIRSKLIAVSLRSYKNGLERMHLKNCCRPPTTALIKKSMIKKDKVVNVLTEAQLPSPETNLTLEGCNEYQTCNVLNAPIEPPHSSQMVNIELGLNDDKETSRTKIQRKTQWNIWNRCKNISLEQLPTIKRLKKFASTSLKGLYYLVIGFSKGTISVLFHLFNIFSRITHVAQPSCNLSQGGAATRIQTATGPTEFPQLEISVCTQIVVGRGNGNTTSFSMNDGRWTVNRPPTT